MKNNIVMIGISVILVVAMVFGISTAIHGEKGEDETEKIVIDVTNLCDSSLKAMGIHVYNGDDIVCGQTGMNADGSSYKQGEVISFSLIDKDLESISDENALLKVVITVSDGNNSYDVKGSITIKKEFGRSYKVKLYGNIDNGFIIGE